MKPEETIDYHVRAVWLAIYRMYNQISMKHDISTSLAYVLINIHSEEGTQATKIAPLMGLESRSLTRMLKSMEDKGLIYRKKDTNDKRAVRIFLTEEGQRKKDISWQTVRGFNEEIREIIPGNDLDKFFEIMTKVNQYINKT